MIKKNLSIHIIAMILFLVPIVKKIYAMINKMKVVADYESTFTTVLIVLILIIGLYMQRIIDSKILCLESIYHSRSSVFNMLLLSMEVYCSSVILIFYLIYSICSNSIGLFVKSFFMIFIIYIPVIAIIFCIGYLMNNYIVSSAISWGLFCIVIIVYFMINNEFLHNIFLLACLNKCSKGTIDIIGAVMYATFSVVFFLFIFIVSKNAIRRIEYK